MTLQQGRHFLNIPGPSPVPERVLQAMNRQVIDHRGPEFGRLGREVLEGCRAIFQTKGPVLIFPGSDTGAWEATIVNTLSPGDRALMFETGHFATLWSRMAARWGIAVEFIPGDWRHGADPAIVEAKLAEDKAHAIKAVMVVHNETSTGLTSRVAQVRRAIDAADHPARLLVDSISGLSSADLRHDEWGIDVTVACSQKGLMLAPGPRPHGNIRESSRGVQDQYPAPLVLGRDAQAERGGLFPLYSRDQPPVRPARGDRMMREEGLPAIFARHERLAKATRAAIQGWGLEVLCQEPSEYSPVLTAVILPDGHDAEAFRQLALDRFNIPLGAGLSKL